MKQNLFKFQTQDTDFGEIYNEQKAYNHSKLCNILFAKALANRINGMVSEPFHYFSFSTL